MSDVLAPGYENGLETVHSRVLFSPKTFYF